MSSDYTEQALDILVSNYSRGNLALIAHKREETEDGKSIVLQYTFKMGRTPLNEDTVAERCPPQFVEWREDD